VKLSDLEATFIRYEAREPHAEALRLNPKAKVAHWVIPVESFEEAHGVQFACPKSTAERGKAHAHRARLWFWGAPVDPEIGKNKLGKPKRWRVVSGKTLDSLTLAPAIAEEDDFCGWAGTVQNGEVATAPAEKAKKKRLA